MVNVMQVGVVATPDINSFDLTTRDQFIMGMAHPPIPMYVSPFIPF